MFHFMYGIATGLILYPLVSKLVPLYIFPLLAKLWNKFVAKPVDDITKTEPVSKDKKV